MTNTFTDILGIQGTYKRAVKNNIESLTGNTFIDTQNNKTYTENDALTNISSLNPLVDWFYNGAALRNEQDTSRILSLFETAFQYNKTQALRTLFYIRDVRGGQGERRVFRVVLTYLGNIETEWVCNNLSLISEYGRYDDYLPLLSTPCKDSVIQYLGTQLEKDLKHHFANELTSISLLAKWLPSENASSKQIKQYARILLESGKFGSNKAYRKALTILRKDLDIVETKLTNKEYDKIDYAKLPSYAALKYNKAFMRNDEKRYTQYLEDLKQGKTKVNASTLYPYDLVRKYFGDKYYLHALREVNDLVEEQWKALPDYVPEINGIAVCDTSGSMEGLPMEVSLSLGVYIAERNKSNIWKNYIIPFSSDAQWIHLTGNTLAEKLRQVYTGDCSDTNLQAVFDLILNRAVINKVKQEDMPKVLLIISDMEFNDTNNKTTNLEEARKKYNDAGYQLPTMVWWNVASRHNQSPATITDKGNILLSGCSPSCLKIALSGTSNLLDTVLDIIEQDKYTKIKYSD